MNRMDVTKWTVVAATGELVVVGLILLVRPQLFAWLVYGAEFSDAGKALGDLSKNGSYEAAKRNALGVPVLDVAGKKRVPSIAVLRKLGLDGDDRQQDA